MSYMERQDDLPIRICFIIDRLGMAGTEKQLLALIQGLNRAIVKPFLCLLDGDDELSYSLEPQDCLTIRLHVHSLHKPSTIRAAWNFIHFLRTNKIDIVQTHFPDSTYFAVLLARLVGIKWIVNTRRDLGYWMKPIDRWLTPIYNLFISATITNCEACRQAVITQEKISGKFVVVLENGIDVDSFVQINSTTTHVNGRPLRVGMVANIRPIKAHDDFIRAAAIVLKDFPNVEFVLAGNGDATTVMQLAENYGIQNHIKLAGSVTAIPDFLSRLDVAVLSSHSEGLSNAILEYMAAGCPIVATAVGGNVELIENENNGLLSPPGNPDAIACAIIHFLRDPEYASRLGAVARQNAVEKYSMKSMLRRYEEFYSNLVRTHGRNCTSKQCLN
jgi:L-malate glycosyltransferase